MPARDVGREAGWYRTPVRDALMLPGRIALLQADAAGGSSLHVLAGIGPTLWLGADGRSTAELAALAVSEHGDAGAPDGPDARGAERAVADAMAELAARGIVAQGILDGTR